MNSLSHIVYSEMFDSAYIAVEEAGMMPLPRPFEEGIAVIVPRKAKRHY
jgi:hypothetical protein